MWHFSYNFEISTHADKDMHLENALIFEAQGQGQMLSLNGITLCHFVIKSYNIITMITK